MSEQKALRKSMKPSWVFAMALGAAIGWGAYILPFEWMQEAGLAGTVIGFAVGGLMIAIIGLSYGHAIRALPLPAVVLPSPWQRSAVLTSSLRGGP